MLKRMHGGVSVAMFVTICLILFARTQTITAQGASLKTTWLILHATDKLGSPVPADTLRDVEVTEHGEKLQIVNGPKLPGPKRIALVIDSNFHQEKVLSLEKETADALLSQFEKEKSQAVVMNYGTRIYSSGGLTDDWESLKHFNRSIQADTDRRDPTILMRDGLKRAMETLGDSLGIKAVVLFAEGNGYGDSVALKALVRLAEQKHIACYVVLFADHTFYGTKSIRKYGWDLVELAPKTGGKFWEAGSYPGKATKFVQKIIGDIHSQCLIEVVPSARVSAFHRVKITSQGRRLEAQTGYVDY